MSARSHAPAVLEPEYLEGFRAIFEEKIVFNQTIGLKLDLVVPGRVEAHLGMRRELIGHYAHGRLHGGVAEPDDVPLGAAAERARDVQGRTDGRSARQDEAPQRLEIGLGGIYPRFEAADVLVAESRLADAPGDPGVRISQPGTEREEIVL